MRTLRFIVNDDEIMRDPTCDFTGLFPGENDEVQAEFICSPEWQRCVKVAAFLSLMGKEYEPQLIKEDNTCLIPVEALNNPVFKVKLVGKSRGKVYETGEVTVYQRGGTK